MIIITRTKLKFLEAGRPLQLEVPNPGRYTKGRTYAAGFKHNRTVCRVEVIQATESGLTVKLAGLDPPRLLAAHSQFGYTDDPHRAMQDEPEAVGLEDQRRLTALGGFRWKQEATHREAMSQLLMLNERLDQLEAAYRRGNSHLEPDLRVIRQRIQAIKTRQRLAA